MASKSSALLARAPYTNDTVTITRTHAPAHGELPSELIGQILRYHSEDKATISICALVCRVWHIEASRLRMSKKELVRYQDQLDEFFELLKPPYSGLRVLPIESLTIRSKESKADFDVMDNFLHWRTSDGLPLSAVLTSILKLTFDSVRMGELTSAGLHTLTNFERVTALELDWVTFPYSHTLLLPIIALKSLELATLRGCRVGTVTREATFTPTHERLKALVLKDASRDVLTVFATGIRYKKGLRALHLAFINYRVPIDVIHESQLLLKTAGPSLDELKVEITANGTFYLETEKQAFLDMLRLPHNPNLRHIILDIVAEWLILPFVKGLTMDTVQDLVFTLDCGIISPDKQTYWAELDHLLASSQFEQLKALRFFLFRRLDNRFVDELHRLLPRFSSRGEITEAAF